MDRSKKTSSIYADDASLIGVEVKNGLIKNYITTKSFNMIHQEKYIPSVARPPTCHKRAFFMPDQVTAKCSSSPVA